MNAAQALGFVRRHGIVLMAAGGPVPSLAAEIAGEALHGSWWSHPRSHEMFAAFQTLADAKEVLQCKLIGGKVTYVHRRLWPALIRLRALLPKGGLAAIHEEHTATGKHRLRVIPFPRWVPPGVLEEAEQLTEAAARRAIGLDRVDRLLAPRRAKGARRKPAGGGIRKRED